VELERVIIIIIIIIIIIDDDCDDDNNVLYKTQEQTTDYRGGILSVRVYYNRSAKLVTVEGRSEGLRDTHAVWQRQHLCCPHMWSRDKINSR